MGNKKLYKKIFIEFCTGFNDSVNNLKKMLEENNIEEATRLVHTIKGISGNLGAMELYSASERLEKMFKESITSSSSDQTLDSKKIKESLKKLYKLIKEDSFDCQDSLDELTEAFGNNGRFSSEIKQLSNFIQNFEYDKALPVVEKIAKLLNISLL